MKSSRRYLCVFFVPLFFIPVSCEYQGGELGDLDGRVGIQAYGAISPLKEKSLSGAKGSVSRFKLEVPGGASSVVIKIRPGSGDPDMYVSRDSEPTSEDYDCRPLKRGEKREVCSFSSSGTYYIMVRGYTGYSGWFLKGSYEGGDGDGGGGGDVPGKCAEVQEFEAGTLSCPSGQVIGSVDFASYGLPEGSCDIGFSTGGCHASSTKGEVEASCLNKRSCTVAAENEIFGDPCPGNGKRLAVVFSCVSGDGDGGGGGGDTGSYEGTGKPLPLAQYMLGECNPDEQEILKTEGFTKFAYVSVGNWTKIGTIQGSPMLPQRLLDSVAREFKRALEPIIERYPDRMRDLLDFNKGTINVVMVWGAGPWGVSAFMGDDGMFFKRNAASDGGFFHELGHVFDIHDTGASKFRQHVNSVLAAEDADVLDRYCHKDDRFINDDGTCQYSEYVAEKYREMIYPDWRKTLKQTLPEVYDVLLKYIPTPSSYVPFPDHEYLE